MTWGDFASKESFYIPRYFCSSGWIEHAPFAFWLAHTFKPKRFVELGTHNGYSYFAFCQALVEHDDRAAWAIDHWLGDKHATYYDESVFEDVRAHNKAHYSQFSNLLRTDFDTAAEQFSDHSIDLLHIDGGHSYEEVEHDFVTWRPKLTDDAIVLFHDICIHHEGFGVWKLWGEICHIVPAFEFHHGYGLGLLIPGRMIRENMLPFWDAVAQTPDAIRQFYGSLGARVSRLVKVKGMYEGIPIYSEDVCLINTARKAVGG